MLVMSNLQAASCRVRARSKQDAADHKSIFGFPTWSGSFIVTCAITFAFLKALHLFGLANGLYLMMARADGIKQCAAQRKSVFGFPPWLG